MSLCPTRLLRCSLTNSSRVHSRSNHARRHRWRKKPLRVEKCDSEIGKEASQSITGLVEAVRAANRGGSQGRTMTRLLISAVFAVLIAPAARAEGLDGTKLYEICGHHDFSSSENTVCAYYVKGFIEGMLFGDFSAKVTVGYCPPEEGISVEQGRLIIEKYMRDNPAILHRHAGVIAGEALLTAFPCKKSN